MSRTLDSQQHESLRQFLVTKRKVAKMNQVELARKLRRPQSFISDIERGQRRVDVVELLLLAKALKFDPHEAIEQLLG